MDYHESAQSEPYAPCIQFLVLSWPGRYKHATHQAFKTWISWIKTIPVCIYKVKTHITKDQWWILKSYICLSVYFKQLWGTNNIWNIESKVWPRYDASNKYWKINSPCKFYNQGLLIIGNLEVLLIISILSTFHFWLITRRRFVGYMK